MKNAISTNWKSHNRVSRNIDNYFNWLTEWMSWRSKCRKTLQLLIRNDNNNTTTISNSGHADAIEWHYKKTKRSNMRILDLIYLNWTSSNFCDNIFMDFPPPPWPYYSLFDTIHWKEYFFRNIKYQIIEMGNLYSSILLEIFFIIQSVPSHTHTHSAVHLRMLRGYLVRTVRCPTRSKCVSEKKW